MCPTAAPRGPPVETTKTVSHAGRCHPSSYDNSSLSTRIWLPNSHLSVYSPPVCTILRSTLNRSFEGHDVWTAVKGKLARRHGCACSISISTMETSVAGLSEKIASETLLSETRRGSVELTDQSREWAYTSQSLHTSSQLFAEGRRLWSDATNCITWGGGGKKKINNKISLFVESVINFHDLCNIVSLIWHNHNLKRLSSLRRIRTPKTRHEHHSRKTDHFLPIFPSHHWSNKTENQERNINICCS